MAAFCIDTAGPRPLVAGHGAGAQILLRAVTSGFMRARPRRDHADAAAPAPAASRAQGPRRASSPAPARCPGWTASIAHAREGRRPPRARREAQRARQPRRARPRPPRDGRRRGQPEPRALVGARGARAGRAARSARCSTAYPRSTCPSCCCGPTRTTPTRSSEAEEALDLLPDGAAARPVRHRLPHRVRRRGRRGAGAVGLLRLTCPAGFSTRSLRRQHQMATIEQLWGGETTKAIDNFPVSGEPIPASVVHWLGRIKAAAARTNAELGLLDGDVAERIGGAGDQIAAGEHDAQFPIDVFQTGSGTSLEHERERGHRDARRRGRAPQRPREHGAVLQRRLPLRRAPRRARHRDERAPAGARGAREVLRRRRPRSSATS